MKKFDVCLSDKKGDIISSFLVEGFDAAKEKADYLITDLIFFVGAMLMLSRRRVWARALGLTMMFEASKCYPRTHHTRQVIDDSN